MFTINKTCNTQSRWNGFRLAFHCALFIVTASAQAFQGTPAAVSAQLSDKAAKAMDALRRGNLAEADIDLLARERFVQAIPDLKKQFESIEDEKDKDRLATALVRLGDKDPAAWNYLTARAGEALSSDVPDIQQFDANGKTSSSDPSPKFLAWAKAHNLTPEAAEQRMALNDTAVLLLGESGDRRAIPLLRQGLSSQDSILQVFSARGLAQLQDKASIPLIVAACEQAPAGVAAAIARWLLDFNDPEAKSGAKVFLPADLVK